MVAQSRGANFVDASTATKKINPATKKDDALLQRALHDISDEFDLTTGHYLEQLEFWGKEILNRNPRKENE